jgi:hypothetical protein
MLPKNTEMIAGGDSFAYRRQVNNLRPVLLPLQDSPCQVIFVPPGLTNNLHGVSLKSRRERCGVPLPRFLPVRYAVCFLAIFYRVVYNANSSAHACYAAAHASRDVVAPASNVKPLICSDCSRLRVFCEGNAGEKRCESVARKDALAFAVHPACKAKRV